MLDLDRFSVRYIFDWSVNFNIGWDFSHVIIFNLVYIIAFGFLCFAYLGTFWDSRICKILVLKFSDM